MSSEGREWLSGLEGGYRLEAYACPAGVPTISAGVTRYHAGKNGRVKLGDKLASFDEARALFARVLKVYEAAVDALTRDDLFQHEFDALTSFAYNVGPKALETSTLVRQVNGRYDPDHVARQFARWVYCDGELLDGLVLRRKAESECYCGNGYLSYDDVKEAA
jgi:lysozyme